MASLEAALRNAERAEEHLSYASDLLSEAERKIAGSYYTPVDVARYFWTEYCYRAGISSTSDAAALLENYHFIEPAAGAGVLFFSLLDKLAEKGVEAKRIAEINATFIDINGSALAFIKSEIAKLETRFNLVFKNVKYIHSDFRTPFEAQTRRPLFIFGNPPFVDTRGAGTLWSNIFAEFVDIALDKILERGVVHLIVPLSIAFSRDYLSLRQKMRARNYAVDLSSFDNIPDTLFKAGKPRHTNTNKANSQRCSIITITPGHRFRLRSSRLIRWRRRERESVLGEQTLLVDVSSYVFDGQFPRPASKKVIEYLRSSEKEPRAKEYLCAEGRFPLDVAGVARNFIGIRLQEGAGSNRLNFSTAKERLKFALLLSSDLFFDYWLTVGDGFHVTKSNIVGFPISAALDRALEKHVDVMDGLWKRKKVHVKTKQNAGTSVQTLDFSQVVPSLYDVLKGDD